MSGGGGYARDRLGPDGFELHPPRTGANRIETFHGISRIDQASRLVDALAS